MAKKQVGVGQAKAKEWRRNWWVLGCVLILSIAMVESGGPDTPKVNCGLAKFRLGACAASVMGVNPPNPSRACCDVLRSTTPQEICECKLLSNATSSIPRFNFTAAQAMPSKCNLTISAPFQCSP